MSLFQAREWWSAPVDNGADPDATLRCGRRALCVGNVDNQVPPADKIIVGGFDGVVRVYFPSQREYRIEDLIVEKNIGKPVLQVECGRFLANKNDIGVCLLHPRSLAVYELTPVGGMGANARYFDFVIQYEHQLEAPAHSLVFGQFGGYDKDSICVQSMDGRWSMFQQDAVAFVCTIPDILIPGPLAYVSRTDSFICVDSQMECQCYTYQALGSSSGAAMAGPGPRALQKSWSMNLGQHAVQILTARFTESIAASQSDIVVLGERSLFALKPQGQLALQKILDANPSCACTYPTSNGAATFGSKHNLIIGTHAKSLSVFRGSELIWAAKTKDVPIAVAVATFAGISGLIVVLFQSGEIQICYLGTDPPATSKPVTEGKDVDYAAIAAEYRSLQKFIRHAQISQLAMDPTDHVKLSCDPPRHCDVHRSAVAPPGASSDIAVDGQGVPISCTLELKIAYQGSYPIRTLQIAVDAGPGFIAERNIFVIHNFAPTGGSSSVVPIRIYASRSRLPPNAAVRVMASFLTVDDQPRVSTVTVPLPFAMIGNVVAPVRSTQFFVTIDTNRPAPSSLRDLFPGVHQGEVPNILSVKYHCRGLDCSIVLSKNAGRYRVQSSELAGLNLLTLELISRLNTYWNQAGEVQQSASASAGPLRLTCDGPLPVDDLWNVVDRHLQGRLDIRVNAQVMENLSKQIRAIQKRLLARFKDTTPAPLANLDLLLRESLQSMLERGDATRALQGDVDRLANDIGSVMSLLCALISSAYGMDENNATSLQAYLTSRVDDGMDQGWEERLDASLAYLLMTTLAKDDKKSGTQLSSEMTIPGDTKRLRKHMKIVCDRLAKGQTIYREPELSKKSRKAAKAAAATAE